MNLRTPASLLAAVLLAAVSAFAAGEHSAPGDPRDVKPLTEGASAPAFNARTVTGDQYRFNPRSLRQPVLLIFYRGGWCPYCNAHLSQLRTAQPKLAELGYEVLFLSADRPELLRPSLKEQDLPYTILSDAEMHAARAFGIAFRVDDETVKRYKEWNIDLEKVSGQTHHELPVPAVFIIDRMGTVRFAHWNADYKVRISAEELLGAATAAVRASR